MSSRFLSALAATLLLGAAQQALAITAVVQIWQATGNGTSTNPTQQALPTNPAEQTTPLAQFWYTGNINFNDQSEATDTLSNFFAGGGGTIAACNGIDCAGTTALKSGVTLSNGTFGLATLMEFGFSVSGPTTGAITHDDGVSLWNATNSTEYLNSSAPTAAIVSQYSIPESGQYNLWYVAANGAPSVLDATFNNVPAPTSLGLLGVGLAGALLARRRAAALA